MAQVKAFEWYQQNMPVAIPGMKADSTVDVVDSFAAEGGVNPGDLVIRGTDPANQCKTVTAATLAAFAVGVAVHTHKDYSGEGAYYINGEAVPVMTFGDICVGAGDDSITAGGQVYISNGTDNDVVYVSGGEGAVSVPGMSYLTDATAAGDIVVVRVRK